MSKRTGSYDEGISVPDVRKPVPRRLFSLESAKSTGDRDVPQGPRELIDETKRRNPVNKSFTQPSHVYSTTTEEPWAPVETTSPTEYVIEDAAQPQGTSLSKLEPLRQGSFEPIRSGTSTTNTPPAPFPPSKLWDNLRHHVLVSAVRPSTPTQQAGTPKPSRFPKLGLKHVVGDVVTVELDARKFAGDILRACGLARYGEQKLTKDREGSNASQPSNSGGKRLDYLRRPLSIASMSTPQQPVSAPSLRSLYQILVHYSEKVNVLRFVPHLPYESRVLSTLLCPFLSVTKYPVTRLDEEQITAVEAFELLSKCWTPADEAAVADRFIWCTKAVASLPQPSTRSRILTSLPRQLSPPPNRIGLQISVQSFQSLASNSLCLLAALNRSPHNINQPPSSYAAADVQSDICHVQDVINTTLSASIEVEERTITEEYGVKYSSSDGRNPEVVKRAIFIETMLKCIENSRAAGEWIMCNAVEKYWPVVSDPKPTNLQSVISNRRLNTFCRISQIFLRPSLEMSISSPSANRRMSSASLDSVDILPLNVRPILSLISILQTRVVPEAEALSVGTVLDDRVILETRIRVARVLLDITRLRVEEHSGRDDVFGGIIASNTQKDLLQHVKWAVQTVARWYRIGTASPWRSVLEKTFHQLVHGDWRNSVPIFLALLHNVPEDIKKNLFSSILPSINDQLVNDPPPYPYAELSDFLSTLSHLWPPLFYKPLFACAASDKEVIVVNHLCTIQVHAKYVNDYWIRDPEMLRVALLSDIKVTDSGTQDGKWGIAGLGQLVLLVELIGRLQKLRHEKEDSTNASDSQFVEVVRFVLALETGVWKMIEAKERNSLLPPSQRMLFCMLLREFRLLTRSLKPASWLSTTLQWFNEFCADEYLGKLEQEVMESVQRVQGLYMAAQAGVQQIHKKRHSSIVATSNMRAESGRTPDSNKLLDLAALFVEHRKLIDSLSKGYIPRAMKLFVTLSTLISPEDYRVLGATLWQHCLLDNVDTSSTASACFLLMQCAEKATLDLLPAIEIDLHASDDITRLEAVRKVGVLISWRFQISTQNFLTDRSHRPFKLGRPPLPFVATDLGSSLYVPLEEVTQNKDNGDVPMELRKRLEELGWVEDDARGVDPRQELIKTPLSILPLDQMNRMEVGTGEVFAASTSPLPSPQPSPRRPQNQQGLGTADEAAGLLRRNSSSGGPVGGLKRRAVFVPPLSSIFEHLTRLIFDTNLAIASGARTTLLDLMRSDPALLTRSVLDQLAGENKDIRCAMSTLSALIHVRQMLPPPLTHYLLNNLGGLLKFISKNAETPDAVNDFGQIMPVTTSLVVQVSGMSMREIRRSKMEYIFVPSGALWFPSSAPKSLMFPRSLEDSKPPLEPVPTRLYSISMIRASQNLFFLAMLKRNYKDVLTVRKSMTKLVLPSLDENSSSKGLELRDFLPRKEPFNEVLPRNRETINILSLMVARSHILLVAQIFRSMPRHLSDRHELAVLVDGLNRCLLLHGDDLNIVSQVLIALMVASARFRRLFLTGGGYALFMPALVKVYTEQPAHPGIRSAIEYAINRFYALHKDAFLYQSIHIIGQIAVLPDVDEDSFSKGVFDLYASLRKPASTSSIDMAGIHNVNKAEEREAFLIHTADEAPQTFLAAIRRGESQSGLQMNLQLPEEYETGRLNMDDFVRLLLTVIAHDLTISRAQHFLRLLRLLCPHLYNASASTRAVLADGIVALGSIFTKAFSKPRGGELPKSLSEQEDDSFLPAIPGLENFVKEKTKMPSESRGMRLDFLQLVLSFGLAGGTVSPLVAQQTIEVTKSLLKDWGEPGFRTLGTFLNDFVKMLFIREEALPAKGVVAVLQRLAPLLHAFMGVNLTGVFETIIRILPVPIYSHDVAFSQVIVGEICSAGLAACDLAASENRLMDLPYRPTLVCLLAEAIFLRDVDIVEELEKRSPTCHFLAGVILPLVLVMKTGAQIVTDSTRTDVHRHMLSNAWVRLLFYSINACQQSQLDTSDISNVSGSVRSKSSRTQDNLLHRSHLWALTIGLQIIKVIIVRGAEDISFLPSLGVWERLASFLQMVLSEGNADFALKPDATSSRVTTPIGSPRVSAEFESFSSNPAHNLSVSTSSGLNSQSYFNGNPKSSGHLRHIDYCLWSMLEFVCAYRSPLRMHLKLLTTEKILAINHELQQGTRSLGTSLSSSPSIRRISASIGLRARQRASARIFPSPDLSPHLHPSHSTPSPSPSNLSPSLSVLFPSPSTPANVGPSPVMLEIPSMTVRRPGYTISPITPYDRAPGWPKIVHLGPSSSSTLQPAPSSLIGLGLRTISRGGPSRANSSTNPYSPKVKSSVLSHETYCRIRRVQTFMGYDLLLPLPSSGVKSRNAEDISLPAWTKSQALATVVQETNIFLAEYEETSQIEDSSINSETEPSTPINAATPAIP